MEEFENGNGVRLLQVDGVEKALECIHNVGKEKGDYMFMIISSFCLGAMMSDRIKNLEKMTEGIAL